MVRKLGIGATAIFVLLAAQRMLVPFDVQVGSEFDVENVLPIYRECGRTAYVLFAPESELADIGPGFGAECSRWARTRAAEAGGLLLLAALTAVVATRGRVRHVRPMDDTLRPLPKVDGTVTGRTRTPSAEAAAGPQSGESPVRDVGQPWDASIQDSLEDPHADQVRPDGP
jgi:hypothetical protein